MRKALYILGALEDADVEWLVRTGEIRNIGPGEQLIEQGCRIEYLYLLLEGLLRVTVRGDGNAIEIATLQPGEIVGEISFVDSRPPSASVHAAKSSWVLGVQRDKLSARLEKETAFAARFYHAIAGFLADRLYVTVGRFGYGSHQQDADIDEIPEDAMDSISLASVRFDRLLKQLRGDYRARGAGIS